MPRMASTADWLPGRHLVKRLRSAVVTCIAPCADQHSEEEYDDGVFEKDRFKLFQDETGKRLQKKEGDQPRKPMGELVKSLFNQIHIDGIAGGKLYDFNWFRLEALGAREIGRGTHAMGPPHHHCTFTHWHATLQPDFVIVWTLQVHHRAWPAQPEYASHSSSQ
eukprot:Protomagalhaensia_sp_Gyna_25__5668@NODE_801_length_2593_cov_304_487471_g197_i1_p4_GENE_NODE_801_length_2593_cov_304_487471_g197_i1NODE_801_length_2593_cov_304_487471_g197_i1_p4_ORF_typecomplete_len164_score23_78EssA/PF10661_9/0_064_NODE_801_length_2593_cov_304_487471_g197_i119562447